MRSGEYVDDDGVMALATADYLGRNIVVYGFQVSEIESTRRYSLICGTTSVGKGIEFPDIHHDRIFLLDPVWPRAVLQTALSY